MFNFVPPTIPTEDEMNLSIFYLSTRGCPEQVLISRTYSIIKETVLKENNYFKAIKGFQMLETGSIKLGMTLFDVCITSQVSFLYVSNFHSTVVGNEGCFVNNSP